MRTVHVSTLDSSHTVSYTHARCSTIYYYSTVVEQTTSRVANRQWRPKSAVRLSRSLPNLLRKAWPFSPSIPGHADILNVMLIQFRARPQRPRCPRCPRYRSRMERLLLEYGGRIRNNRCMPIVYADDTVTINNMIQEIRQGDRNKQSHRKQDQREHLLCIREPSLPNSEFPLPLFMWGVFSSSHIVSYAYVTRIA